MLRAITECDLALCSLIYRCERRPQAGFPPIFKLCAPNRYHGCRWRAYWVGAAWRIPT